MRILFESPRSAYRSERAVQYIVEQITLNPALSFQIASESPEAARETMRRVIEKLRGLGLEIPEAIQKAADDEE